MGIVNFKIELPAVAVYYFEIPVKPVLFNSVAAVIGPYINRILDGTVNNDIAAGKIGGNQ